jgi:hypothetical protein
MRRGPLWFEAVLVAAAIAVVLGLLHGLGVGLKLLLLVALVLAVVGVLVPRMGVRWWDEAVMALRTVLWRTESGRFYAFDGLPLKTDEQFGHLWLAASSLQQVLRRPEDETVTAARMPGQWHRNEQGEVMLKVTEVVHHLSHMPGREDPRVQRFRRYLERELLFPAAKRNRAS